ncbi:MAG TPA: PPC domain-containing protein, partial [Candidatus Dormibacteraeota bacterium]|nr:PPC domain-containing protein [Candidatus Dormibacteraeota bacterium]
MRHSLFVAALLLLVADLCAQPAPKLASISPEWIQRGTTRELVLSGENLGQVTEILFNGEPGLSATNVPAGPAPAKPTVTVESSAGGITRAEPASPKDEKRLVLRVTATSEASLVPRELRVVGPGGVSNPLNLNVGQWAEVNRLDNNTSLADAQVVELPAVISGAISGAAQTNFYRFKAQKGQEFVFDVDAVRRGSALDSSLSVSDAQGKELGRSEDGVGLDSLLFFTPPADGDYVLALSDFRYRGGATYSYRLTAGAIPYVESYFPFGGQRGKSVEVSLQGYNLEGTSKMTLTIDPKARRSQDLRLRTSRGYSNLLPFDVSDLAEVSENEPNNVLT